MLKEEKEGDLQGDNEDTRSVEAEEDLQDAFDSLLKESTKIK